MTTINAKGYEFSIAPIRDSFNRRAVQYRNKIIAALKRTGLTEDDIDIELEPNAIRKAPASVSWYINKQHLHYSHSSRSKYVENLYVVFKVINLEVTALLEGRIALEDFINEFSEEIDVAKKRKEARVVLGLGHEVNDIKAIDKAYKGLAKKHHPDTEEGNTEKFKEINSAHKILRRELR